MEFLTTHQDAIVAFIASLLAMVMAYLRIFPSEKGMNIFGKIDKYFNKILDVLKIPNPHKIEKDDDNKPS